MVEAQGDFNRPWLVASFGTEYLPSIPDLHERLSNGAKVADVACGVGWAAISLARAYPNVTGERVRPRRISDRDRPTQRGRGRGGRSGTFEARDAADPALKGAYDFATVIEAIHDLSQPVAVLGAIHEMLKPGGTLMVADERTEDAFTAPASETERLFYAYSVLCCLPSAMDDPRPRRPAPSCARMRSSATRRRLGFDTVSVLPMSTTSSASTESTASLLR